MTIIGKNIRYLRKNKKLSQVQLGEVVGKSESTIQMWETGFRSPTMASVKKLSDFFEVDMNEFVEVDFQNSKNSDDYNINIDYLSKNYPNLVDLYNEIHSNDQLVILFDKAKKLEPEDLAHVLKIIDTFNKETK